MLSALPLFILSLFAVIAIPSFYNHTKYQPLDHQASRSRQQPNSGNRKFNAYL